MLLNSLELTVDDVDAGLRQVGDWPVVKLPKRAIATPAGSTCCFDDLRQAREIASADLGLLIRVRGRPLPLAAAITLMQPSARPLLAGLAVEIAIGAVKVSVCVWLLIVLQLGPVLDDPRE